MEFMVEQALLLAACLVVVGRILKGIERLPDWCIPLALLLPGVGGALALCGFSVQGAAQGVLAVGLAVYGNQVFKQVTERE